MDNEHSGPSLARRRSVFRKKSTLKQATNLSCEIANRSSKLLNLCNELAFAH